MNRKPARRDRAEQHQSGGESTQPGFDRAIGWLADRWARPVGVLLAAALLLVGQATWRPQSAPAESAPGESTVELKPDSDRYFETHIAPLLARNCLDCHDSLTEDGGLDLTRKAAAFAGDDDAVIIPGDSDGSRLWQQVESDEMPQNRAPLTDQEKARLKRWIDAGAVWSIDKIDPEAYLHEGRAAATWLQRLTVEEYIETVRATVGVDIGVEARRMLPRDERADGFTNTAYNLGVDLSHVEAYARLAKLIVARIDIPTFAKQYVSCDATDDRCFRELISAVGKTMLRGPLSEAEVDVYLKVSHAVVESGGDFSEAVGYVVQAMLQSPRFLYRVERQLGDGTTQSADEYELASRLSYIVWGGPPDERLMKAADEGRLSNLDVMKSEVRRMLDDPRAERRSLQFVHEWIDLNRLESLRPNPDRFPNWNEQLAGDMRDETVAFFRDLVWEQDRPLWELLNAPFTYATPRLALHYGLYGEPEDSSDDASQRRVDDGLLALYTFDERDGDTVRDRSRKGDPLDLKITDPAGVRWQPGGLGFDAATIVTSERPPARLIEALRKSDAISIEAWVTPADSLQAGPARMVTLSNGISSRNFTLGQSADRFEVRLRTTETSSNGEPSLSSSSGSVATAPTHVVYTRDSSGKAVIYINGQESESRKVAGSFKNWDDKFHLALGNELSGDRLWRGTMHLAAIYDRALPVADIRQNHAAGGAVIGDELAALAVAAAWERADQRDLVALYRFDEGDGDVVRDRSEAGEPLDLKIDRPTAVGWVGGGLTVYGSTSIATAQPPRRLTAAIKSSQELTVEAWLTPANATQGGPARIVTLSSGTSQRNFTLGQDGDRFDARLRAARTDNNGLPAQSGPSGAAGPQLTHVVFTKDAEGQARLFVNGEQQASASVGGDLSKWDDRYLLALANESTQDRPWRGTYHLVAIYSRALSVEEIRSQGLGMTRYDLADHPARGGLLTQGSVLTIGGDEASMVARGLFVLHDLLYSRVGNPPPCVDTTPVPTKQGMSMRGLAEARLADAACAGCHVRFEPLAFGLEKFDGIGGYQEIDEHGNRLREDGEILFPGRREAVKYETSEQLMDLLAESDRVRMAITRKVTQFALGRPLVAADMPHLEKIHAASIEGGGTYPALMTAIVTSDLVRMTRTEN